MKIKALKPVAKIAHRITKFTTKNSNWILAILTALGVFGVAEEFTRATIKAVKICEEKELKDKKEIVKEVWKLYIPGVGIVIATIIATCGNAHINAKKLAMVTGMYVAKEADLKAFQEKAKEILGPGKEKKIEQETECEKLDKNPPPKEDEIVKTGHGDQLFMLGWTGKYFRANPDYLELKMRELNNELVTEPDNEICENRFNEMLDLPYCEAGNAFWSQYDMQLEGYSKIELDITTCKWMEVNGKKEMVSTVRFVPSPKLV